MNKKLFKNKYRIASTRLKGYDYSKNGFYFVTICTKHKHPYFGKIVGEKMVLNDIGEMAGKYWRKIPKHFANIKLDNYIIMPNHVHGILVIDNTTGVDDGICVGNATCRDEACLVSTDVLNDINIDISAKMQKISPKPKSLPVIIGSYKSTVTRESKQITSNFIWQTKFYDHIIRSKQSLHNIRQYIIDNPLKWEDDINNDGVWM